MAVVGIRPLARLERPMVEADRHPWTVVGHAQPHRAGNAVGGHGDRRLGVAGRVGHDRRQDPGQDLRASADLEVRGRRHRRPQTVAAQRSQGLAHHGLDVAPARGLGDRLGGVGEQGVEQAGHTVRRLGDHGIGANPLLLGARPLLQQLCLSGDEGQGGAQLVRELGCQLLLVPQHRADPVEDGVQAGSQLAQLVGPWRVPEPVLDVVRAPLRCLVGHLRDGGEGVRHDPSGDE
jgi:hypothetical protein